MTVAETTETQGSTLQWHTAPVAMSRSGGWLPGESTTHSSISDV